MITRGDSGSSDSDKFMREEPPHDPSTLLPAVDRFLNEIYQVVAVFTEDDGRVRYAELFHHRMLACGDVFSTKQILSYVPLLEAYINHLNALNDDPSPAVAESRSRKKKTAQEIVVYMLTHQEDFDQALIGLRPSPLVLKEMKDPLTEVIRFDYARKLAAASDGSAAASSSNAAPPPAASELSDVEKLLKKAQLQVGKHVAPGARSIFPRRKDVVEIVLHWAEADQHSPDDDMLMGSVIEIGQLFQSEQLIENIWKGQKLFPGGLVVAAFPQTTLDRLQRAHERLLLHQETSGNSPRRTEHAANTSSSSKDQAAVKNQHQKCQVGFRFCRFVSPGPRDTALVFPWADERRAISVEWKQIIPLATEHKHLLGHSRSMKQLVDDPIDRLYLELNTFVREETFQFLEKCGIDQKLLDKALENKISITELTAVKEMRSILHNLCTEPPKEFVAFIDRIDHQSSSRVNDLLSNFQQTDLFAPTREAGLQAIQSTNFGELAKVRINRYVGFCDAALGHLELQKRDLMNGSQKQQMTEWWLGLIEGRVDEFLNNIDGWNPKAVPEDYIEKAPDSIADVRSNLNVIREVLDPKADKHGTHKLLESLKGEIYPRIDEFVTNARITLSEHFSIDEKDFELKKVQALFEKERKDLDEKIEEWIDDMIKDMEYLQQIQEAEKRTEEGQTNTGGGLELGPVPISGLIIGCFYRQENELTTVIDCWGYLEPEQTEQKSIEAASSAQVSDDPTS